MWWPLIQDNRVLVSHGLKNYQTASTGFDRIIGSFWCIQPERVNSGHLGFQLGPRVNAAGRLSDAGMAVALFRTKRYAKCEAVSATSRSKKVTRRSLEKQMTDEAIDLIEHQGLHKSSRVLIVSQHIGILVWWVHVARLAERFQEGPRS